MSIALKGASAAVLLAAATRLALTGVAGFLLTSCGSNAALLAERQKTEAEQLMEACRRTALSTAETQRADGLVASSAARLKDGDEEAALPEGELAAILYRLALARRELTETQAAVETLKASLAKDKDQLHTYQQVLEEVKAKRKP